MQQLNKNAFITVSSWSTTLHYPLLWSFWRSCRSENPWLPTETKLLLILQLQFFEEKALEEYVNFCQKMIRNIQNHTFLTTSIPSITFPNTTCFPSSQLVLALVIKNWLPLVLGPAFAIESIPGSVWVSLKFSSSNLVP